MKLEVSKEFGYLKNWLSEMPQCFMSGEGTLLHQGRNIVRLFALSTTTRLVVKRFRPVNPLQQVAYTFFCPTKAEKAFRFAALLRERGFDTPHEVAYIEKKRWGLFRVGYFVSICCDAPSAFPVLESAENYDKEMALDLAALFVRLHRKGVLHGDLNLGNFLYRKETGGHYAFSIIDTNRSRFLSQCPDEEACLYDLRTLTHRRDLFCFIVREYARIRQWNPETTEKKALCYLEQMELKHTQKELWKKFMKRLFPK